MTEHWSGRGEFKSCCFFPCVRIVYLYVCLCPDCQHHQGNNIQIYEWNISNVKEMGCFILDMAVRYACSKMYIMFYPHILVRCAAGI